MAGEPIAPIGEGGQVDLYTTVTDAGVNDTFTYAWSITKDGQAWTPLAETSLTDSDLSFVPSDNGTYVATVVITDNDGGSVTVNSQPILVSNSDPAATIAGVPNSSTEGDPLELSADVTDDGIADTFEYAWSVTKDGDPVDLTGIASDAASFNYTPRDNGTYVISLTVVDDDGGSTNTSATITVANATPAPTIDGDDTVDEGQSITLTASPNDAGVDDTHTYSWSVTRNGSAYNSGLGATNATAFTFTPNLHGTYVATVVVTDNNGDSATVTKTITVNDVAPTITITGTPSGPRAEGSPLTFGSTVSDVSGESSFTYAWSVKRDGQTFALPNGVTANASTFEFEPTDNGQYRVTLAVTDSGGQTTTATTNNITVTNALPAAEISGTPVSPVNEGSAVTLTVDAADPGSEDTLNYAWTVTKNGQPYTLPQQVVTTGTTFTFTPTNEGTYAVKVVVTDDDGGPTTVTTGNIVVNNVAPTVVINDAPSSSLSEGTIISLTATGTDPGADTLTYSWSVTKDGQPFGTPTSPATTAGFNFRPTDNGSYVVTVVVNDGLATQTTSTAPITITNVAPTGTISGPATSDEGAAVTITTAATDAGSADTLTYAWTLTKDGDNVTLPNGMITNAASFTFQPDDQGEYEFTCVFTDDDGGTTTLTHSLTVANAAPTVSLGNVVSTGTEGTAITVDSTASDPGDDLLTYGWTVYRNGEQYTLPDGTAIDGASFTFTPGDNGSYVIRLSVADEDGGITTVNSNPITVTNAAPVAEISGEETVDEGELATYTSTVTDAGAVDTETGFSYAWTAKRGNTIVATGDNADFSFTPAVHGSYSITLVATDKDGTSTTTQSAVTVDNVAPTDLAIEGELEDLTEGDNIALTTSASDAPGDTLTYAWQAFRGSTLFASGTGEDIAFKAARGSYEITVTATDTAGATTTASRNVYVHNAPPEATLTGPAETVLVGSQNAFSLSIDDVPANQPFSVIWDFGDGETATNSYTGDTTATRKHAYSTPGTYTVTASVSDGVDITVVTTTVNVSAAITTTDPADSSKTALIVLGTANDDTINVTQNANGRYTVNLNGETLGTAYRATGRLYVYGNGGGNTISVAGSNDAFVFAGSSASNVTTGAGNDVIVGSAGADRISSGAGRDVVIGGLGADILRGGDGDDILIAGNVKSVDVASLKSAADKWTTSQDIATRRKNLSAVFAKQLISDGGSNQLYGESQNDWFLINTQADKLRDLQKTDLIN
ncbi:MAG: PKD domain-containing protein [Tepidisphaeraceae bacterium]